MNTQPIAEQVADDLSWIGPWLDKCNKRMEEVCFYQYMSELNERFGPMPTSALRQSPNATELPGRSEPNPIHHRHPTPLDSEGAD